MTTLLRSYAAISRYESFKHENLQLSENFIRLFQVQPGVKDDPISLRITQYAIARRPKYIAVSYTWGSATNSHVILVNGRSFQIHANLWNLLFQLRQRKVTSFFWADRMCIDQGNLSERNFHVRFMGKIYEQAISVIVWLGMPAADRTEIRAMEFIKDIVYLAGKHSASALSQILLASDLQHRWHTLLRMCQHYYWSRTWIVQEFVRAPRIEAMCGSASLDWSDFETALDSIQGPLYSSHPTIKLLLQTRPARLTLRRRSQNSSTLHELLQEYHDSQCTERRDKIYGILGLASDCPQGQDDQSSSLGVNPDYNKHIVVVYLDVVDCISKSLQNQSLAPSAVNLARRALLLTEKDFESYISNSLSTQSPLPVLKISASYVSTVSRVSAWSSTRDLRQRLEQIDWGEHVGYEVTAFRLGFGRRSSSRIVHSALPDDLVQNVLNVAEVEDLSWLHNYSSIADLRLSPDLISSHRLDKQLHDNLSRDKPRLFLEQCTESNEMRVGFACTNVRNGDLILQFQGLDAALVVREIGTEAKLVGKAIMVKHNRLQREFLLDEVCEPSSWFSPCPTGVATRSMTLETDALSLAELLSRPA